MASQSSSLRLGFGVQTRMEPEPCDMESGSPGDEVNSDRSGMATWNSDPIRIAGSEATENITNCQ